MHRDRDQRFSTCLRAARPALLSVFAPLMLAACFAPAEREEAQEAVDIEQSLSKGFPLTPEERRIGRLLQDDDFVCSATVIDPHWALSARHCLSQDKNPELYKVVLGSEPRQVTAIALHPDHLEKVDVILLRLASPFSNIPSTELPIWPDKTSDLFGYWALCAGYGGTDPNLTGEFFQIASAGGYPYYDAKKFYLLDAMTPGAALVDGDSGSSCNYGGYITGVHKGAGQVSAEVWRSWAEKRRDCPVFDPNHPSTTFCTPECPCDVGEGDCGSCQPGLKCVADAGAKFGLPAKYDVCDRVDPAVCGTFNPSNPKEDFCQYAPNICPCTHGEGDCDDDLECGGSLECQLNSGYAVGLPSHYDICVYPPAPGCRHYDPAVNDMSFCTAACPCDIGQGDCDGDAQCRGGLVCANHVGSEFQKPADFDICVRP